jgi:hypothetical protein
MALSFGSVIFYLYICLNQLKQYTMEKFLKMMMIEAIKQQVYQQENRGLKKPFEVLVSVKETSEQRGEVFTSKVCLN